MPTDVSVVIPVLQRPLTLEQTLLSVLRQNDVSIEVLLMDGSQDGDVEHIVRTLHDPRIRYLRQVKSANNRTAVLHNRAWPQARAALIHFLDCGDTVTDGHYTHVRSAFAQRPGLGVALGMLEGFGEDGEDVSRECQRLADGVASLAGHRGSRMALVSQLLFGAPLFIGGAAVIRKRCLMSVGGYNTSLEGMEDVDICARIIHRFGACFLDTVGLRHRIGRSRQQGPHAQQTVEGSSRAVRESFCTAYGTLEFNLLKLVARTTSAAAGSARGVARRLRKNKLTATSVSWAGSPGTR
jgi:cellulose synthase/poly-beta-1,6-N-acetylglucosamine synthase-like glycosyltransferase